MVYEFFSEEFDNCCNKYNFSSPVCICTNTVLGWQVQASVFILKEVSLSHSAACEMPSLFTHQLDQHPTSCIISGSKSNLKSVSFLKEKCQGLLCPHLHALHQLS